MLQWISNIVLTFIDKGLLRLHCFVIFTKIYGDGLLFYQPRSGMVKERVKRRGRRGQLAHRHPNHIGAKGPN